jgi:hypothetical protein
LSALFWFSFFAVGSVIDCRRQVLFSSSIQACLSGGEANDAKRKNNNYNNSLSAT